MPLKNTDQPRTRPQLCHDLDTGCGHAGRLTVMEVGSRQYWQSDPVAKS